MHPSFQEHLARQHREQLQREAVTMRLATEMPPRKAVAPASPLEHPAFRRLWLGLTISRMGDALRPLLHLIARER